MNLKIAYMTGEYLPISPFAFIFREIQALRKLGVHVETISIRRTDPSEVISKDQIAEDARTYYVLPLSLPKFMFSHCKLLMASPALYFSALRLALATRSPGMIALLKQLAYFGEAGLVADRMNNQGLRHLHNHNADSSCTVAMLAACLGEFTFSFTIHGPGVFFEPDRWRIDEKVRRAAFVLCISHFCRSQTMIFSPVDTWDNLHILRCAVDPAAYEIREHNPAGKCLMFTGRLAAVKGLPILLESIAEIRDHTPELRLTLAGDGPDRTWLEGYAKKLGIEDLVDFLGYQTPEQVTQLLAESDIFVLPSFAEGVPVVLMEAMASGLPVIATRIAGISELVEDGTAGFLVPPGDPRQLQDAIETLLRDSALRARMGQAGRDKVERDFNIHTEGKRLLDILQELPDNR